MPDLPLTGGCLCGGVRYEIDQPLTVAGYCHCKRCQRRTGSGAAVSGWAVPGSVRFVQGEELLQAFEPPDGFHKLFCSACGSAICSRNPADPTRLGMRLGTFDGDPGIRPSFHQWVDSAAAWEEIPVDGLTRYPQGRA